MSFSPCRAWSPLFLSTLERQATASLRYLPPNHCCAIDYPTKLKPTGPQSHIYSGAHAAAKKGPFYSVEVAVVGCYGEGKFLESTFVVPSLVPSTSLQQYGVEYDTSLEVYIVQHAPLVINGSRNNADISTSIEGQPHIEDWFDAEPITLEQDEEDLESHDDQNDVSPGVIRVENFPVMSRKVCDVKDQQSPDLTASVHSDGDQDLESSGLQSLGSSKETNTTQTNISPEEEKFAGLLDLDSFSWADEVEGEEEITACPITNYPAQKQEIDLLKCDDFNWADEVDDEKPSPSKTMENIPESEILRYESFDWSDESDAEELATEETNGNGVNIYAPFIVNSTQSSYERPTSPVTVGTEKPQEDSTLSSGTEDQQNVETGIPECDEEYQEDAELSMELAVRYHNNVSRMEWECYVQDSQAKDYPHIHHFNWLGFGIVEPSETPAEVSLAVILSGPKTWLCGNPTSREAVTLSQAFRYVDPVLYEGDAEALSLRGSELQRAVTGSTSKFYSSYGTWTSDTYGGDEERPFIDPMDVDFYGPLLSFPVNGWYDKVTVPTRDAELSKFQNHVGRSAWEVVEKKSRPYRVSPLRNASTDEEGEASSQCERGLRVVRGKMQYWAHEGRKVEALPVPEEGEPAELEKLEQGVSGGVVLGGDLVEGLDDDVPSDYGIGDTYCSPSDSDLSTHSRPSSSDSSHTTLSGSTTATTIDSDDLTLPTTPTSLLTTGKTVIHSLRRRLSFPRMASEMVMMGETDSQTEAKDARISTPSLVLPPLATPEEGSHSSGSNSNPTPPPKPKPKSGYIRLQLKSEPVQASVSDSHEPAVLEFISHPSGLEGVAVGKGPSTGGGQKKRIWERTWRQVLKLSRWKTPPTPPPMDAVQSLQLCIRG